MFRFLHSSDLHLGKRFGNFPDDLRGRLREARHGAIGRLAAQALANGANTILLAGDTFDTETPTPAILRQALAEMGRHASLTWIMLPGNHDSLLADQLWDAARAAAPANVVLAVTTAPIDLAPDITVLPAPCTARRPGRDLTDWMSSAATPEGTLRIGLAHGAIQQFSEDTAASDVIAPNRATLAGLDYLALGDWHGQIAVNERTWYSGTPEPDRFKHDRPGSALLVTLDGAGAPPQVSAVETASFTWRDLSLELLSGEDGVMALETLLPIAVDRRQTLLRVMANGRTRLPARTALLAALDQIAPDFAHLEVNADGLATDADAADLDRIDRSGALRDAANALLLESQDAARSEAEREIANAALVRLFTYCEAIAP
ncbi:DNA repair exonuclease [Devosia sp. YR412]|uniref:metallophosphoesterase family protein n=1 Tax=Devosia sp. YR412 TaxID=1881030 RepID=UPI000B828D9F|nr:DNA repair exonuclease [Devosia sp. YR412]